MSARRWVWTDEGDRYLRQTYDGTVKGCVQGIANKLGVPRWVVSKRAQILGLTRTKEPYWSQEDESYLAANISHVSLEMLAKHLNRTVAAIVLKKKRLGVSKLHSEGYTGGALAEALGVDGKWVSYRVRDGILPGRRRQTSRTPQQGGDAYLFTDEDVMRMVVDYPGELDIRKVNETWFMDLVAEGFRKILNGHHQA